MQFLRYIFFNRIAPLIRLGRQRPLKAEDMPEIIDDLRTLKAEDGFSNLQTRTDLGFVLKSFVAAGATSRRSLIVELVRFPLALSGPFLMRELLHGLGRMDTTPGLFTSTLAFALALAVVSISDGIIIQHYYYHTLMGFGRIMNGLNLRVFRHALRLKRSAQMNTHSGDVVNHIASDAYGVAEAAFFVPETIFLSVFTVSVICMLVYFLGAAAFVSLGVLVLLTPLTRLAAKRFQKNDTELWEHRDQRVTLMSQIINGIRVIKYFAWEKSILHEVDNVRLKETGALVRIMKNEALNTLLFVSTSTLVAFAGFGTYVLMGGQLTLELIFPCLLLFVQLETPVGNLSHLIKNVAHARVAARRLRGFFALETMDDDPRAETATGDPVAVSLQDLKIEYPQPAGHGASETESSAQIVCAVQDVTLHIPAGQSVAIVGAVGAGKSSLLMALLGETEPTAGSVRFPGVPETHRPRIAFVPQEAYTLNATVRQNILFGQPEDDIDTVLFQSALTGEVAQMNGGLDTEIGERGVNLSGGQKHRLALARAAVYNPGLVLLDDPLAAVDIHTEAHLVEHLIFGRWKDATRIVATHRLGHLARFDRVLFMERGRVVADGTLQQVMQSSPAFRAFFDEHEHAEDIASTLAANVLQSPGASGGDGDGRLVDDEDREVGAVKAEVFKDYINALGGPDRRRAFWIYCALAGSTLLLIILPLAQTTWLGWWADSFRRGVFRWEWMASPLMAVGVYGAIGVLVLAAHYWEMVAWLLRGAAAGRQVHTRALKATLAAPLRFFDTTPAGRILNRFSRDVESAEDELAWNFESSLRSMATMVGVLIYILVVAPVVALVAVPALVVFYRIQRDYRKSAREAKRLESIARSPRIAHFKETIMGLPVIRSYRMQGQFTQKYVELQDEYQRQFWGSIMLNRWFSTRAPALSGVIALAVSTAVVYLVSTGALSAGTAGVVVTLSISFWGNLNWCVRSFSEVEMRMTGYERLRTYQMLESEPDTTIAPVLDPTEQWPAGGTIRFQDVWARYAPNLPWVLRGVSFSIPSGSRVGIVGRTGSGKTTLFQTLFRFVEAGRGQILIDGVDIARVPHERLRRALAVIPQDPMLFIGTVRTNLDRFGQFGDQEIWAALRRVKMDRTLEALGGLEARVVENGHNFSQGQRQLLCLARAILIGAQVIVMDEATASVDVQTDALIQQTIRQEFAGVTLLIIAHRLNSVADADLIIEMSHGQVERLIRPGSLQQAGGLTTEA